MAAEAADNMDRLGAWYDAVAPRLFHYAAAMLGDAGEAEEALQEVFVKLAAQMRGGGIPREPERYLFRAVRNACYSRLRRRRWHWLRRSVLREDTAAAKSARAGEAAEVRAMLEMLPPAQREVVVFKVIEERTFAEIGTLLGISANTAASRYRYAMEKLRAAARDGAAVMDVRREAGEQL